MRKRFRFSLERILGLRRLEERMRRSEFASAQALLVDAERSRDRSQNDFGSFQQALAALRQRPEIPVAECLQMEAMMEDLLRTIARKQRVIQGRRAEVQRAREAYLAASTRRKALAKLRETRLADHRKENQKREAQRFDGLASERAFQSRSEES